MNQNVVRPMLVAALILVSASLFGQTVSQSGSLTYEYPIKTPPGAGGMAPELSLYYDSSMENGILGMGWSIKGLSIITRDPSYPITFDDTTDHFVYSGQKLIKGTDGFYHTKYESFLRIQFDVANSYWTVTDKQGRTSFFGNTADSHIGAIAHTGKTRVWALSKVQDTLGNYFAVVYYNDASTGAYYPNQIVYTRNDSHQLSAFNAINFSYESRTDCTPMYIPSAVSTTQRLKWITVLIAGTSSKLIRKYRVDYQYSGSSGRSQMTAIQEYGDDGNWPSAGLVSSFTAAGTTLPSVGFGWQSGNGGFDTDTWNSGGRLVDNNSLAWFADVDGDGKADLISKGQPGASNAGVVYVRLSNGTGYPDRTWDSGNRFVDDNSPLWFGDVDGDGKADLISKGQPGASNAGVVYVSLSDGTGYGHGTGHGDWTWHSVGRLVDDNSPVWFADVNGDGRVDLISKGQPGASNAGVVYVSLSDGTGYRGWTWHGAGRLVDDNSPVWFGDVNGDGKADLITKGQPGASNAGVVYVSLSNGTGYTTWTWGSGSRLVDDNSPVWFADVNGDGKADLISKGQPGASNAGVVYVSLSDGTGYRGWTWGSGSRLLDDNSLVWFGDVNGDGKADLVSEGQGVSNAGVVYMRLSTGTGYPGWTWVSTGYWTSTLFDRAFLADVNGDGKDDLAVATGVGIVRVNSSNYTSDLLTTITLPTGGSIAVTYTPATQVPGAVIPANSAYPIVANSNPRPLVTKLVHNDGLGGTSSSTSYSYSNGLLLNGTPDVRKDLGFASMTSKDDFTGAYTTTYYRQLPPYDGLVDRVVTYDKDGKSYLETANFYVANPNPLPGNATAQAGVNYVYKTAQETHNYNGETTYDTYREEYKYDAYGNVVQIANKGDVTNAYDDVTVDINYAINTTNWVMAQSLKKVSSYDLNDTWGLSAQEQDYYDGLASGQIATGLLTSKVSGNGDTTATETYGYDAYGNLIWTRDGRANAGEYTTHTADIAYDSFYYAYLTTHANAIGQTTTISYDSLMRPITITDPSSQSWSIQYDVFSRQTATVYPLDSSSNPTTTTTYLDGQFPRGILNCKGSGSTAIDSYTYYDGLGRVIQTKNKDVNGWVTVDTFYDAAGRAYRTSVAYESSVYTRTAADITQKYSQQDYDAIGRVSRIWHPDGTSSQIPIYGKKSITAVDENMHVAQRQFDGHVTTDIRYTGTYPSQMVYSTTTIKSSLNGVRITDTNGNVLQTTLDILGRKTAYSDPDMGSWSYSYDADGNLLSQTDAKGQIRTVQYDRLNRVTTKQFPDGSTETYTYDEPTHGVAPVGNLTTATFSRGSESFVYDARGRITADTKTLDGSSQGINYVYDSLDRLQTKIYPDGENVTHSYDLRGNLASLTGTNSYQYVYRIQYTPNGRMSQMTYGNGAVTNYDYYDDSTKIDQSAGTTYSYRLRGISITNGLVNIARTNYQYDKKDNLVLKDFVGDNASGTGQLSYTEQYGYDELDRLISANAPDLYGSKTYLYDELDNITLKDGRTYSYGATKPHAVLSDGTYTYTYDANGNMATRSDGRTIIYDAANRVTAISDGGTYSYDDGGQRTIKTENGVSTYYFFPEYEEIRQSGQPTIAVKYYFVNGMRIAERSSADGLLFYHADHLGSAVRITKDDGAIAKTIAYDPYGATAYEDGTPTITHKFTDQVQDTASGLYYYGARYYDPILGRFISPDTELDGLNRYTYCHNNPVRYTDPTGTDVGNPGHDGYNSQGSPTNINGSGHQPGTTGGSDSQTKPTRHDDKVGNVTQTWYDDSDSSRPSAPKTTGKLGSSSDETSKGLGPSAIVTDPAQPPDTRGEAHPRPKPSLLKQDHRLKQGLIGQ